MTYSSEVLADSPTAYWPLESGTSEASGGTAATISGASTSTTGKPSGLGGFYDFNGSSDYGSVPIDLSGTSIATIEWWGRWDTYANDDDFMFEYSPNVNSNNNSFWVDPNASGGGFQVNMKLSGLTFHTVNYSRSDISSATWHHFVLIMDRANGTAADRVRLWVDGTLLTGTIQNNSTLGDFGNYTLYLMSRAGAGLFGDGAMCNLAIYKGVALSDSRIAAHYTAGIDFPILAVPELWLDASDTATITDSSGSVTAWNDKSGKANHLESFGSPYNPTTNATTLNGLNVVDFDGGDALYDSAAASVWKYLHDGTNYIIAAVVKITSTNGGILGTADGGSGLIGTYVYKSGTQLWHAVNTSTGGGDVVLNQSASSTVGTTNPFRFTILADPDNGTAASRSDMRVDGGSSIANNAATTAPSSSNPTYRPRFGAMASTGDTTTAFMTGYIAELVVIKGADATSANAAALDSYLDTKWFGGSSTTPISDTDSFTFTDGTPTVLALTAKADTDSLAFTEDAVSITSLTAKADTDSFTATDAASLAFRTSLVATDLFRATELNFLNYSPTPPLNVKFSGHRVYAQLADADNLPATPSPSRTFRMPTTTEDLDLYLLDENLTIIDPAGLTMTFDVGTPGVRVEGVDDDITAEPSGVGDPLVWITIPGGLNPGVYSCRLTVNTGTVEDPVYRSYPTEPITLIVED